MQSDITFVPDISYIISHLQGMTLFYRAITSHVWGLKRYALIATALFIIAAAPVLLSLQDQSFSINENAASGTPVGAIVPATDGEGNALHFAIIGGNTGEAFSLDPSTGELTVANAAALDFEVTASYALSVRATAKQGTDSEVHTDIRVQVAVNDVAESATVSGGSATAISEGAATLQGAAQANGSPTTVAFQIGTSPTLPAVDPATLTGAQTLAAGAASTAINTSFNGLQAGTAYYYRLVAKNSTGTVYGETLSFSTFSVPQVISIERVGASPTNEVNLLFRISFSEGVSGVDASDFRISKNGTVSGSIATVEELSASIYQVTVSSVAGNGALKITFVDDNSVTSTNAVPVGGRLAGDGDFTDGEVYLVDNTAPVVAITSPVHPYTQMGPLTYTITYSDAKTVTLSPADVILDVTPAVAGKPMPSGTVEITQISSLEYRVAIKQITGDGTLRIRIAAGTAVDAAGNLAGASPYSGTTIVDNTKPVGICPPNVTFEHNTGPCKPFVRVALPDFSDTNEPGVVVVTNDFTRTADASSDNYPVGETTTIKWTFTDQSGNYDICYSTVTVEDKLPPVIAAMPDITVYTEAGRCDAVVNYELPTATDCSGDVAVIPASTNVPSGSRFFTGAPTVISYSSTDPSGNTANGSFKIIVLDREAPAIICPEIITTVYEIKPGEDGVIVDYAPVTATDNCTASEAIAISRLSGYASGANVPAGVHTYKFRATDAAGNFAECSFIIRVVHNDPPVIGGGGGGSGNGGFGNDWTYEDVAKDYSFRVTDGVTPVDDLKVSVTADDATLFPQANIVLEGSNDNLRLRLSPAQHRHGASKITITVMDNAGHTGKAEFILTVIAVADEPIIALAANPLVGKEEDNVPLGLSMSLADADGSESLSAINILNVPAGASLSAGTNMGDGKWQLQAAEVPGLSIRGEECLGNFSLTIWAASREASNNDEAETQAVLAVQMTCVNDAPSFSLDNAVISQREDFSETNPDTQVLIHVLDLADVDTELSNIKFSLEPAVDWVNMQIDENTGTVLITSIKDKNYPWAATFTLWANDQERERNRFSQTFTLAIDTVNDAPYGKVISAKGQQPIAFEVETESGVELFPAIYKDVDVYDLGSKEKVTVVLEGAPEWLWVEHGYVDKNDNEVQENSEWRSQLVANPPLSEEGNTYTIKAWVRDEQNANLLNPEDLDEQGNPKRYDEFQVTVVCHNALPKVAEDEMTVALELNRPLETPYEFFVIDDQKSFGPDGVSVKAEAVDVDPAMLTKVEIKYIGDGGWAITNVVPAVNQYGETSFRIKISDYVYCQADLAGLEENGERTPVYIDVQVIIKIEDVLDIPNLITPNGDGANDTWNILGLEEYQQHEIRIFDTRGRIIFSSRQYGPGREWDGTLNGALMPDGTYTYQIFFNEGKEKREGRISIAR